MASLAPSDDHQVLEISTSPLSVAIWMLCLLPLKSGITVRASGHEIEWADG